MLLVGKIDFKNNDINDGYDQPISLKFELPRRLRRRAKLKLRYMGFLKSFHQNGALGPPSYDVSDDNSVKQYFWRYNPDAIKLRIKGNGEDLLGDHSFVKNERFNTQGDVISDNSNEIFFDASIGTIAFEKSGGAKANNNNDYIRFAWINKGYNETHDLTLCDLEENISEIECLFDIVRDKDGYYLGRDQFVFSGEEKVWISSITVKFELIE